MWPVSSKSTTSNSQTAEVLKLIEKIRVDSKHALDASIPSKILSLTSLIETFSQPSSPFREINNASPDELIEHSPIGKKRKLDSMNNTISSLEVQDGIEFENNNVSKRIQDLFQLIQEELEELSNFAQKLSLSRILRSKKDDSEETIQDDEECISEFNRATELAQRALGDPMKYYAARSVWSLAIEQHPSIRENSFAMFELDKSAIRNCKQCLIRIRDVYLILIHISQKHLASN